MRITPSAWRRSAKRVAVARGQVADAEHADQGFQLVGQGHHHAHVLRGSCVARKAKGLVVVFNGVGHGFGRPSFARSSRP